MEEDPPHPDSERWLKAQSMADLLSLTRLFLQGEVAVFPGWGASDTDEETDDFEGALLDANRGGLLSVASQPGSPFGPGFDGRTVGGRAFVGGFCTEAALGPLVAAARAGQILAAVERPGAAVLWPPIPAGLQGGSPYLILGPGAREAELEIFGEAVGKRALAELKEAPFLWLVDPVWGRRSRLPAVLHQANGLCLPGSADRANPVPGGA